MGLEEEAQKAAATTRTRAETALSRSPVGRRGTGSSSGSGTRATKWRRWRGNVCRRRLGLRVSGREEARSRKKERREIKRRVKRGKERGEDERAGEFFILRSQIPVFVPQADKTAQRLERERADREYAMRLHQREIV